METKQVSFEYLLTPVPIVTVWFTVFIKHKTTMDQSHRVFKPSKAAIRLANKLQNFLTKNTPRGRQRAKKLEKEMELREMELRSYMFNRIAKQSRIIQSKIVCNLQHF